MAWEQRLRRMRRQVLTRTPGLVPAVLWARRRGGSDKVNRILETSEDVRRHYQVTPRTVIFGQGQKTTLTSLSGARVMAQPAAVIGGDGALLWPFSPQLDRRPRATDALWRHSSAALHIPHRSLYAAVDGFSYYHWLLGTVPRLIAGKRGVPFEFDRFVVNPRHKGKDGFQLDTFRLLGIPLERVLWLWRGVHLHFEDLTLPEEPCTESQTELTPWARHLLRETFLPHVAGSLDGPKRLYISRAKARRRRLIGEDALARALEHDGFTTVYLEDLPLLSQVRLFAGAQTIVGMHGAGLANLVFAAPGTKVVELLPEVWRNPCFANLAISGGQAYESVPVAPVGPKRGFQADGCVDIEAVRVACSRLSAALK